MDQRFADLHRWLLQWYTITRLEPIVGDASFRRYFRLTEGHQTYIVMDAPPDLEPCQAFIDLALRYREAGLRTPQLFQQDTQLGFLVMEDFGYRLFYKVLAPENVHRLYDAAISKLPLIQKVQASSQGPLPVFGEEMLRKELDNFTHWYLEKYLGFKIDAKTQEILDRTYRLLIQSAISQPQVGIHRDYHSRNLMELPNNEVGILDFQDAMIGPVTYDLVSLIRDCYVEWPDRKVYTWLIEFHQTLSSDISYPQLERWFDWMGMQRHLKAMFIFARKHFRDQNSTYLQFLPVTWDYVRVMSEKYPEFYDFRHLFP